MRVLDTLLWTTLRNKVGINYPDDYNNGKILIQFCENWCDIMETHIDRNIDYGVDTEWNDLVRHTIPARKHFPFLDSTEIGEALVLISSNWIYGEEFFSGLTEIERKIFVEAVQRMTASQQLAAQDTSQPTKHLA